jgi:hypothetical protein
MVQTGKRRYKYPSERMLRAITKIYGAGTEILDIANHIEGGSTAAPF